MPRFNVPLNSNNQFICDVVIHDIENVEQSSQRKNTNKTLGRGKPYKALIDTGASASAITKKVAEDLQLVPCGARPMSTPSGEHKSNLYEIDLGVIYTTGMEKTKEGKMIRIAKFAMPIPTIVAMQIDDNDQFQVLLGMDMIKMGSLIITDVPIIKEGRTYKSCQLTFCL